MDRLFPIGAVDEIIVEGPQIALGYRYELKKDYRVVPGESVMVLYPTR